MDNETFYVENSKKSKKRIIINLVSILPIISAVLFLASIYLINGVENTMRYAVIITIFIMNIIFVLFLRKLGKKESKVKFALFIILTILLSIIQLTLGYFIYKTYNSLDSMNKDKITYTTVITTKENSKIETINDLDNNKIGIVVDETSIDGYIIGLEIINDEKLEDNNEIIEYTTPSELIKDLYKDKIDAMIISKNYPSMFKTIDEYKNIENETKIIHEKSKTLSKKEIAKYTGEEISNFNSSDKIDKPFTMLVMGIDSTTETLDKNATGNGDALMLVTFNPKTLNATILSIPRDTYVPIACFANEKENKITHAAWNGESCMIRTIENFTSIDIDYYVKINFQGVVKLVNALGGIEVDVPIEFCESNSKRSTKEKNLICLEKGKQTLKGEQALALARHRKTLVTGDLERGVNQQLVVQGILNKLKSIRSANQMLNVLDTVSNSMDTNFTTKQILSFYDIAKKLFLTSSKGNLINMQQLYLAGAGQMIYDEGMGLNLYNYIYNQESLDQIVKAMKQNLELEKIKPIKTMSFSISKPYKIETIGTDVTEGANTYNLLPNFIGESESYTTNWLANNGISFDVVTKEVNSNSGYYNGEVISQSMPSGKRLDLISGTITITVAKIIQDEPVEETMPEEIIPSNETENSTVEENTTPDESITEEESVPSDETENSTQTQS